MVRIVEEVSETEARARAERLLDEAARRVLRRRGVPEEAIPAAIERMWRSDPGFALPTREELGLEPLPRGRD
jgi:hypothetical protein